MKKNKSPFIKFKKLADEYDEVFKGNPFGILVAEAKTRKFIFANKVIQKMFNYSEKEFLLKSVDDIHPKDALPKVISEFQAQSKNNKTKANEVPCLKKAGNIFYADVTGRNVTIGKNKYLMGFFTDVTEKRIQEEALHTSENTLKAIIESINSPIFAKDEELKYTVCNEAFLKYLGKSRDEIIGKSVYDISPKDKADIYYQHDKLLLEKREHQIYETKVRYADGTDRDVIFHKSPLIDEFGKIDGMVGIITDITARKIAEEQIKDSEDKYRKLFEDSPVGIFQTKIDGSGLYSANKRFLEMFSYTFDELNKKTIIVLWKDPAHRIRSVNMLKECGHLENDEVELITKHGEIKNCLVSVKLNYECNMIEGSIVDITDLKKTEKALKDSHSQYKTLLSNIPGIVYRARKDWSTEIFHGVDKLTGCDENDYVSGKVNWLDQIHDNDKERILQDSLLLNKNKQSIEQRYRIIDINGNIKWILDKKVSLFDENGEFKGVEGIVFDITEQKIGEEKYIKLFNGARDAIIIANPTSGIITDCNESASELIGLPKDEIIGRHQSFLHPPEDNFTGQSKSFKKHLQVGGGIVIEDKIIRADGKTRDVAIHASIIDLGIEKVIQGIFRDITEQKKYENEIKANALRLECMLHIAQYKFDNLKNFLDFALNEAIVLTSSKIGYIYLYDETTRLFTLNTWSKDVMKECLIVNPQTIYELDKTGIWGEAVRQRISIMVNDFSAPNRYKKGYPEGHSTLYKYLTLPIFRDNKIIAVVGVANKESDYSDIDVKQLTLFMDYIWSVVEKIKYKEEKQNIENQLIHSSRLASIGTLAAGVAHEINNPLTILKGFVDITRTHLRSNNMMDDALTEYIAKQEYSIDRIAKIVKGLSSFARAEDETIETLNVHNIIANAIFFIENIYAKVGISIKQNFKANEFYISGSSNKFQQVIFNLLSNARDALENSKSKTIIIESFNIENTIQINVSDNGHGIDPKHIEKIFDPFFTTKPTGKGTGLGLSITHSIIKSFGGIITVKSELDIGTTFSIIIPAVKIKIFNDSSKEGPIQNKTEKFSGMALIVDDEDDIRFVMLTYLKMFGFEAHEAKTAKEALEKMNKEKYSYVIIDIKMPDLDGDKLLIKAKEILADAKFLMITGGIVTDFTAEQKKRVQENAHGLLNKPFSEEALYNSLKAVSAAGGGYNMGIVFY